MANAPTDALALPTPSRIDALYLHVPFCFHKCHYCDFYSLVESPDTDRQPAFTDALIRELRFWTGRAPLRPRTIFVGGGTPTLLRPALWELLLTALHDLGVLRDVAEFTVEANPETVTPELMRLLAAGGVNRVSMGAQSFQPDLLKALERWHGPASVARAMDITRQAGITNLNLDLIFAIPSQTPTLLDADLDAALTLQPSHLSAYNLTYEPNTALTAKLRLGRIRPIEEDLEAQMYERVLTRLESADYDHYEISNWAKQGVGSRKSEEPPPSPEASPRASGVLPSSLPPTPDSQLPTPCLHNLAYWRNENWLALGPSAAAHLDGHRWKNEPHLARYIAGSPTPPRIDVEYLPPDRRLGEALMLRLRLREGVALDWLAENLPPGDERHRTIDDLVAIGMLERTPGSTSGDGASGGGGALRLTRRGLFVADNVIARLL